MRTEGREGEMGSVLFLCHFLCSLSIYTRLLLSLPLGLKVFGPWAHHTEEV